MLVMLLLLLSAAAATAGGASCTAALRLACPHRIISNGTRSTTVSASCGECAAGANQPTQPRGGVQGCTAAEVEAWCAGMVTAGGGSCPGRAAIEAECGDSRRAGKIGHHCLVCVLAAFPGCPEAEVDGYCSGSTPNTLDTFTFMQTGTMQVPSCHGCCGNSKCT